MIIQIILSLIPRFWNLFPGWNLFSSLLKHLNLLKVQRMCLALDLHCILFLKISFMSSMHFHHLFNFYLNRVYNIFEIVHRLVWIKRFNCLNSMKSSNSYHFENRNWQFYHHRVIHGFRFGRSTWRNNFTFTSLTLMMVPFRLSSF